MATSCGIRLVAVSPAVCAEEESEKRFQMHQDTTPTQTRTRPTRKMRSSVSRRAPGAASDSLPFWSSTCDVLDPKRVAGVGSFSGADCSSMGATTEHGEGPLIAVGSTGSPATTTLGGTTTSLLATCLCHRTPPSKQVAAKDPTANGDNPVSWRRSDAGPSSTATLWEASDERCAVFAPTLAGGSLLGFKASRSRSPTNSCLRASRLSSSFPLV
mmetsp:Transcript_18503/g.49623  ORF Transcript_18503/g.49623 Transcript_18503/m.49623 type:complete len:214 (-) Transcript_18503:385-1026(-)